MDVVECWDISYVHCPLCSALTAALCSSSGFPRMKDNHSKPFQVKLSLANLYVCNIYVLETEFRIANFLESSKLKSLRDTYLLFPSYLKVFLQ